MSDSTRPDSCCLDLERDLPTTVEDVRVLWELRRPHLEEPLAHANRLVSPAWTLAGAAARPLFADGPAFEL